MRIPAGRSWHEDLTGFINNPATADVFNLASDMVRFFDGFTTLEKIEIEDYVLAHFNANKLLMV